MTILNPKLPHGNQAVFQHLEIEYPKSELYDTPIEDMLAGYIFDQLLENDFDEMFISDHVDAILERFTVSEKGEYKWAWASADEIESDLIEMMETRKQLSSAIPDYEPDTPDRVLYTTAMILLSDAPHDDPRIEKIRAALKSNALKESAFDEIEAKQEELKKEQKKSTRDEPKPKHQKWFEDLLLDDYEALMSTTNQPMLIRDILPAVSLCEIFGESGSGKTFITLDMACSIATGTAWQGMPIDDPGAVIYVSAEGTNGLRRRKYGWELTRGVKAPLMRILPASPLLDKNDVKLLSSAICGYEDKTGNAIKLIVVDTLNRCMEGEESNSTEMAKFVRGCEELQAKHKCTVLIVHHSGHGNKDRARGSSALYAALDMEYKVSKNGSTNFLTNTKNKDESELPKISLKMDLVKLPGLIKPDGTEYATLVPRTATLVEEMKASLELSPTEETLIDAIRTVLLDGNVFEPHDARDAFKDHEHNSSKTKDAVSKSYRRAFKSLEDKQVIIEMNGNLVLTR